MRHSNNLSKEVKRNQVKKTSVSQNKRVLLNDDESIDEEENDEATVYLQSSDGLAIITSIEVPVYIDMKENELMNLIQDNIPENNMSIQGMIVFNFVNLPNQVLKDGSNTLLP
jgi:hypothetical protein